MGSVASATTSTTANNNGLSDLLQTLTQENSPLAATLSSPKVEQALENAPASDIVQISEQAMQLQATDALFGISNSSGSSTDSSLFSALASADSESSGSTTSSSTSDSSLADQLAAYQSNMQIQDTQSLLGLSGTSSNTNTNATTSLLNLFG